VGRFLRHSVGTFSGEKRKLSEPSRATDFRLRYSSILADN